MDGNGLFVCPALSLPHIVHSVAPRVLHLTPRSQGLGRAGQHSPGAPGGGSKVQSQWELR